MRDRLTGFFQSIWQGLGRAIGRLVAAIAWPFMAGHGWFSRRGLILKAGVGVVLLLIVLFYGIFFWNTQVWSGFDPNFVADYRLQERKLAAGQELPATPPAAGAQAPAAPATPPASRSCQRSAIVDVAADLTDFNVNRNAWISSTLAYRLGFFGIDWDHTPFFDNKASFQRGVNQAVRRTTAELVDTLGRVRGTSGINNDLQKARGNMQFDEYSWYFGLDPFGPKTPTPSYYRSAIESLRKFNTDLSGCSAIFDTRADNLVQFVDRIANDLGSTSDILAERSENHNFGWFDTRADDRFWFAYGQLYGYYAILEAARADFSGVVAERNLGALFAGTTRQFQAALRIRPAIVSNGREDGWIMPSHLATMGFYILRVRSNLVEIRAVLDR